MISYDVCVLCCKDIYLGKCANQLALGAKLPV